MLAVVHDLASATPAMIRSAASRVCDVVFVCDRDRAHVAASAATISRFAKVVDITGMTVQQRLDAVRAVDPAGIVTFSEYQLARTARLAAGLGLLYHDAATVALLTDKLAQRGQLAEAGVDATPCVLVDGDPAAALSAVGLPAVIKPRTGAGSRNTSRADTREQFLAAASSMPAGTPFVAEGLLHGDSSAAGAFWGDYVSVESVRTAARPPHQICVTGKFALAEPFRETGMFLPCSLDEQLIADVLELEAAALSALGIRCGVTHTEIKLTPAGPRIIEVNGRLGGYVPEILKRATGIDLVRIAIEVALGMEPDVAVPRYDGVTYQCFLAPPDAGGTILSLDGVDALRDLRGVRSVQMHAEPGQRIDWRDGTQGHLGIVYGSAPDLDALQATAEAITQTFRPTYSRPESSPTACVPSR